VVPNAFTALGPNAARFASTLCPLHETPVLATRRPHRTELDR